MEYLYWNIRGIGNQETQLHLFQLLSTHKPDFLFLAEPLEVHWCPPPTNVIKINFDGSSIGAHPCGAAGIVFRDSEALFLGAIASNIGHATALEAEFSACMLAMEKAMELQLTNIILETDSIQVANAFNKNIGVPWKMRARWINCLFFCKNINCSCLQVFRESNNVADSLAKNGQGLSMFSTQRKQQCRCLRFGSL